MSWKGLKEELPSSDLYAVLLFPAKSDIGVLYTVSNPLYARTSYALEAGYTHWMPFELAPDHDKMVDWQNNIPPLTDKEWAEMFKQFKGIE